MPPTFTSRPYGLPRHLEETARLNQQHAVYRSAAGFSLHPTIAVSLDSKAGIQIAEVATGTGVWLLELASQSPSTWTFTGTDMSTAQFPTSDIPTNCEFTQLDILAPIPEEMHNRFDVVHLRLLLLAFTGEQYRIAARNVHRLLKPGGWIQWKDVHGGSIQVLQDRPRASTVYTRRLVNRAVGMSCKYGKMLDYVPRLAEILAECGFVDCVSETFSTDREPRMRALTTRCTTVASAYALKMIAETDGDSGWTVDEVEEVVRGSETECSSGEIYCRSDTIVAIGWKLL